MLLRVLSLWMTCSQPVHGLRKSIRGCKELTPNWRDDWSWPWDGFPVVSVLVYMVTIGIEPLKARHDITKLHLLSFWYIDIDLCWHLRSKQ